MENVYVFVNDIAKKDYDKFTGGKSNNSNYRPLVLSQEEVNSMKSPEIIKIDDPIKAKALIRHAIAKENRTKTVKAHTILSLKAQEALAGMCLAKIEMDNAEEELTKYDGTWNTGITYEI